MTSPRARFRRRRIVLFGESLGTAVAVALAAGHEVAAVILDAPFTSAVEVGAAAYPFAPVRWLMKDKFHSDERIGRVSAPLLVMHGEQDRIVPIRFGERLFALAREPKRLVRFPQGGHVDLDDHGAAKVVQAFLAGAVALAFARRTNMLTLNSFPGKFKNAVQCLQLRPRGGREFRSRYAAAAPASSRR